jgi:ketosteroid isomerase-like protein
MSEENVEIVRASFAAFNAGDMDAWGNLLAADVIWRPRSGWPEPGPFIGREAVLRQVQRNREAWDADTAEPVTAFIDAADRVVVRFAWRVRGHGPQSNWEVTCVYTVRKRKIIAFEFFWDHAEAQDHRFRILLGPRRSPRSRRDRGVGDGLSPSDSTRCWPSGGRARRRAPRAGLLWRFP